LLQGCPLIDHPEMQTSIMTEQTVIYQSQFSSRDVVIQKWAYLAFAHSYPNAASPHHMFSSWLLSLKADAPKQHIAVSAVTLAELLECVVQLDVALVAVKVASGQERCITLDLHHCHCHCRC
jgi:hypothetical protein